MKSKLFVYLFVILVATSLLTACSGGYVNTGWPGLTAGQDVAYLAYGEYVYAINLADGIEKWHYPEKGNAAITFYSAPVLTADGQLLVAGYDNVLYSLDPDTGLEIGKFSDAKNRYISSPLVTANGIFAPSADGKLYALDNSLKQIWTAPFKTSRPLWARPVVDDACECVFQTSMDHHLYAINVQTGLAIWPQAPDLGGASVGSPVYVDGKLYIGTFANELLAIDATNGTITNRYKTEGWVWAGIAAGDGKLYFGDIQGNFYIYDIAENSASKYPANGAILSTPLVTENVIYFASENGNLYALDANGNPSFNIPFEASRIYTSPVVAPVADGEIVLVAPLKDGRVSLVALNPNGSQKWVFNPK